MWEVKTCIKETQENGFTIGGLSIRAATKNNVAALMQLLNHEEKSQKHNKSITNY